MYIANSMFASKLTSTQSYKTTEQTSAEFVPRPALDSNQDVTIGRDGVLEAMALASRRLEDNWSCPWPWPWPWGPSPWPWP